MVDVVVLWVTVKGMVRTRFGRAAGGKRQAGDPPRFAHPAMKTPQGCLFSVLLLSQTEISFWARRRTEERRRGLVEVLSSSLLPSSLELSDAKVNESWLRALLGTASLFCELVFLDLSRSTSFWV